MKWKLSFNNQVDERFFFFSSFILRLRFGIDPLYKFKTASAEGALELIKIVIDSILVVIICGVLKRRAACMPQLSTRPNRL